MSEKRGFRDHVLASDGSMPSVAGRAEPPMRIKRTHSRDRCCRWLALVGCLTWSGVVVAAPPDRDPPPAARNLLDQFPGLQLEMHGSNAMIFYGASMTSGTNPGEAAKNWLTKHTQAFGVPGLDLRLERSHDVAIGSSTVFTYRQFMDGLPVENSLARLLVRRGTASRVVYAAANLAQPPARGFRRDTVGAQAALASVRNLPAYAGLVEWSVPEMVIFNGEEDVTLDAPVRAWKFQGVQPDPSTYEAYSFFVDAAAGTLVHVRNEVYEVGRVNGDASGNATPGLFPDSATNPPVSTDLNTLRVQLDPSETCTQAACSGDWTLTDESANYSIFDRGCASITVRSDLQGSPCAIPLPEGPWVDVQNAQGSELVECVNNVQSPATASFFFNNSPSEFTNSQVNGFLHTTLVHDFYKERQPAFTALDRSILCTVNVTGQCNAFFSAANLSINFFKAGGTCPNMAYAHVVAHEYGHFIVNRLGIVQGAFGEGFSDATAILLYDDPRVGLDFPAPGDILRDYSTSNVQYPCCCGSHFCGQLLGGVWWDTNLNLQNALAVTTGLKVTQQLFIDWSQITLGPEPGNSNNSAYAGTAIEVLTVDDARYGDSDINNGTPHDCEICDAFAGRNISCPYVPVCDPPDGGCCLPDGTCIIADECDCDAQSGTYQGDGSDCNILCPAVIGACCDPLIGCIETTRRDCERRNGFFKGEGTTCPSLCPIIVEDIEPK